MKLLKSARLVLALSFALTAGSAFAQMNWTNMWSTNCSSGWWTNTSWMTNMPMQFSNMFSMQIPSWMTNVLSGLTNCNWSGDTKQMLQQFQANRDAIMQQMNSMTKEQRQALMQQMQALRDQIQAQIAACREQAKDQAESMKQRFRDDRSRMLNQAVGGGSGGRGRGGD